jgi:hypothetical protein
MTSRSGSGAIEPSRHCESSAYSRPHSRRLWEDRKRDHSRERRSSLNHDTRQVAAASAGAPAAGAANQIASATITLCGPPSGRRSALRQPVSRNHASASSSP